MRSAASAISSQTTKISIAKIVVSVSLRLERAFAERTPSRLPSSPPAMKSPARGQSTSLDEAATLHHPAMLRYLDNAQNAVGHINENYAREIMELHTMGVDSGYTQKDVEELARILTGVGINASPQNSHLKPELAGQLIRQGLFEFNPARHDYGDKTLLGHHIAGRGYAEVEEALDILAKQPTTARRMTPADRGRSCVG